MFRKCSFDKTKNEIDCYRGKDCIKNFCVDSREHATKIINYEKMEMIPLTNEGKNYIRSKKYVIYAKKDLVLMIKNIKRLEIIFIIQENTEELLMIFAI